VKVVVGPDLAEDPQHLASVFLDFTAGLFCLLAVPDERSVFVCEGFDHA
jgi:hypothetical protein